MSEQKPDWADEKAQDLVSGNSYGHAGDLIADMAAALRAEREAAKQDTERLDWLLQFIYERGLYGSVKELTGHYGKPDRKDIDAARKSEPTAAGAEQWK